VTTTLRFTLGLLLAGTALHAVARSNAGAPTANPVMLDVPARSDATPSIAAQGAFVAVAWGASADGKADVLVATSRDGGKTFGAPVRVNRVAGEGRLGGELPPRVALRATAGTPRPDVFVLWNARGASTTIQMARSRDGGTTFGAPVALQASGAAGDRGWPALTVDTQGRAHAIWLDHRGLAAARSAGAASKPASGTGHHAHAHTDGPAVDGAVDAQKSSLFYARVGGDATLQPTPEQAVTPGVCYCCKTALAAGPSDTIVAAWRHVYPGDLRDIAMAISRDGGRTFSAPARVSEDGWAINGCPDDGPAVVVDGAGVTHIVWPTVIGTTDPEGALFYSTTRDGKQFTPRVRVPTMGGPKPTHPQLAIGPTGRLVVAWDEMIGRERLSVLREVKNGGATPTFGEPVTLARGGSDNHPVVAVLSDVVVAAWATGGDNSRIATRRIALK